MSKTTKRIVLYLFGLFVLSLGVSLSIRAGYGVSPVSSLAYATTLTTGLSIGLTSVLSNILFIIIQAILSKRVMFREFSSQLLMSFLFGFFMDGTLFLVKLLPIPDSMYTRMALLIISLFVVSAGIISYITAKLPLMPYDALTIVISEKFNIKFSKAKISSDLINVCLAGSICLIFIQSLGSIGIGTFIAAYFIGKIIGWMIRHFQQPLQNWVFKTEKSIEGVSI